MTHSPHPTPEWVRSKIDPQAVPYRALVTGPRDLTEETLVHATLWYAYGLAVAQRRPLTVVHGHCPTGADHHADTWAHRLHHLGHPVTPERHPAQNHPTQDFGPWPGAGPRRNAYMASLGADICYAFMQPCTRPTCRRTDPHDSHGTDNCVRSAQRMGIHVQPIRVQP
jgi:hypothetical protein